MAICSGIRADAALHLAGEDHIGQLLEAVFEPGQLCCGPSPAAALAALRRPAPAGLRLVGVVADTPLGVTHSLCPASPTVGPDARTDRHSLSSPPGLRGFARQSRHACLL
jgi:hypothetical protein